MHFVLAVPSAIHTTGSVTNACFTTGGFAGVARMPSNENVVLGFTAPTSTKLNGKDTGCSV